MILWFCDMLSPYGQVLLGGAGGTSPLVHAVFITQHGSTSWFQIPMLFKWFELWSETWLDLRMQSPGEVEFQPSPSQVSAHCAMVCGGCRVHVEFMTLHQTGFHFGPGIWETTGMCSGTAVPSIRCFTLPEHTPSGSRDGKTGTQNWVVKKWPFFMVVVRHAPQGKGGSLPWCFVSKLILI